MKSFSSTILNLINFFKLKLAAADTGDKMKYKVLVAINNLLTKFVKFLSKHNMKFSLIDSFIGDCFWSFIDLLEFELEYHTTSLSLSIIMM